mgnify:CR=1 FL=1
MNKNDLLKIEIDESMFHIEFLPEQIKITQYEIKTKNMISEIIVPNELISIMKCELERNMLEDIDKFIYEELPKMKKKIL